LNLVQRIQAGWPKCLLLPVQSQVLTPILKLRGYLRKKAFNQTMLCEINIVFQKIRIGISIFFFSCVISICLAGCLTTGYIAHKIIEPPGDSFEGVSTKLRLALSPFYASQGRIIVGPPMAALSVAVLNPGNYPITFATLLKNNKRLVINVHINLLSTPESMYLKSIKSIQHFKPKSTIILLPGYGLSKESMLNYAFLLASQSFKVIMIDLRGQGQSTGTFVTYGPLESNDLVQVISKLKAEGTIIGPLAILGISYGASIALETAAKCPIVKAVIAIEPFSLVRTVIPRFLKAYYPQESRHITTNQIDMGIKYSEHLTGYNIINSGPIDVIANVKSPILYLVGQNDTITLPSEVKSLAEKSYNAKYCEIDNQNHISLPFATQIIWPIISSWLKVNVDNVYAKDNQNDCKK